MGKLFGQDTAYKCRSYPCYVCIKLHGNLIHQDKVINKPEPPQYSRLNQGEGLNQEFPNSILFLHFTYNPIEIFPHFRAVSAISNFFSDFVA